MPAYSFEALDAQGATLKGVLEADTAKAARSQLRSQSLVPLQVLPVGAAGGSAANERSFGLGTRLFARPVYNATGLAIWTRQIAGLVTSGLPPERALTALTDQAEKAIVTATGAKTSATAPVTKETPSSAEARPRATMMPASAATQTVRTASTALSFRPGREARSLNAPGAVPAGCARARSRPGAPRPTIRFAAETPDRETGSCPRPGAPRPSCQSPARTPRRCPGTRLPGPRRKRARGTTGGNWSKRL